MVRRERAGRHRDQLASNGYRPGAVFAFLAGLGEAGGGLLLALGFLTPLGCAAIIGVMLNATVSVHWPKGLWVTNGGYEYPLTLAVVAASIAFIGPGRLSVDHALGLDLYGIRWGLAAVGVGLVSGVLTLTIRSRARRNAVE